MAIKVTCSVNKDTVKINDKLKVYGMVTKDGYEVSRGTVNIYVNGRLFGQAVTDYDGMYSLEKTVTSPPFNPNDTNSIHVVYSEVGAGYGDCYEHVYVESSPTPNESVSIINISYTQSNDIIKITAHIECTGERKKYISPYFAFALPDYAGLGQLADFKRKGYYKGYTFIEGDFVPADFTGTVVAEYKLREKTNWIQKEPTYGWGFGLSKGDISLAKKYGTATITNPFYHPTHEKVEIKSLSYEQAKDIVIIKAKVKCYGEKQKYISPHFEMAIDNYHNYKKCAEFSDKGYITMFGAQEQTEFLPPNFEGTVYAKYFIKDFPDYYQVEPHYCFAFGTRKGDISLGIKCDTAKIENPFYKPKELSISTDKNTVGLYEDFTIYVSGAPNKQVKLQVKKSGLFYRWDDANVSPITLDSSGKGMFKVHFIEEGTYNLRVAYTDNSKTSNEVEITVTKSGGKATTITIVKDNPLSGTASFVIHNLQYSNLRKAILEVSKSPGLAGGTTTITMNDHKVAEYTIWTPYTRDTRDFDVTNYIKTGDNKIDYNASLFAKEDKVTIKLIVYADNVTYSSVSPVTPTPYIPPETMKLIKYVAIALGGVVTLIIFLELFNVLSTVTSVTSLAISKKRG